MINTNRISEWPREGAQSMYKRLYRSLFLLICIFTIGSCSQNTHFSNQQEYANEDIPEKYDNADAVILYEGEILNVLSIDESYLEYSLVKKVQNHKLEGAGTFVYGENPNSKIVNIAATAKYPDGKIIKKSVLYVYL